MRRRAGYDPGVSERGLFYPLGSAQAEELALVAGLKPAIRQRLSRRALDAQRRRLEPLGYACHVLLKGGVNILVAAADPGRAEAILRLDAAALRPGFEGEGFDEVFEHGRLLGYPDCCARAFAYQRVEQGAGTLPACVAALAATEGPLLPRLNVVDPLVFHYLPWIPCRFDCAPSAAYADRLAALIARRYPVFVRKVDYALAAHRIVVEGAGQVSLTGTWRDAETLVVDRVWDTARDRRAGTPYAEANATAIASLVDRIRGARLVTSADGTLRVGDASGVEVERATLFPFGGRSANAVR